MKIEMGESLASSWLKYIRNCKIVEVNWKPSPFWVEKNVDDCIVLYNSISELLMKNDIDIRNNRDYFDFMNQTECDVVGVNIDDSTKPKYFLIDIAFHQNGLNYSNESDKDVLKKTVKNILCTVLYFKSHGDIYFMTPKISEGVIKRRLISSFDMINDFLSSNGNYRGIKVKFLCNEEFRDVVLNPIISKMVNIKSTSDLFVRSILLEKTAQGSETKKQLVAVKNYDFSNKKVGEIADEYLRDLLESRFFTETQMKKFLDPSKSKTMFGISSPLLHPYRDRENYQKDKYYSKLVVVNNKKYYLFNQWYEKHLEDLKKQLMLLAETRGEE
jgi:hypothetical protein